MNKCYDERYVTYFMNTFGETLDFAINECNIKIDAFFSYMFKSQIDKEIENGHPLYLIGVSGIELAMIIFEKNGISVECSKMYSRFCYTKEYWIGQVIAYYQWYTSKTFSQVVSQITYQELDNLYYSLHNESFEKIIETINQIIKEKNLPTNLQVFRTFYGYSQNELAKKTNVSLRMIQQYEQRAKDINKASGLTLLRLSKILGCKIEDLLEL